MRDLFKYGVIAILALAVAPILLMTIGYAFREFLTGRQFSFARDLYVIAVVGLSTGFFFRWLKNKADGK